MPLLAVDAQHQVDLYVLDAADVARALLPGVLVRRPPRATHAQEGGVRHRLRVRRDPVVLVRRQVHVLRLQAAQDRFDLLQRGLAGAVADEDLVG